MPRTYKLLAGIAITAFSALPLHAQVRPAIEVDAAAFGARESAGAMDISPDGKSVVYVGAAPGRNSIVEVADLAGGPAKAILRSSGNPEKLSWCKFASNERLICRFRAILDRAGVLLPFSRQVSVNLDGSDLKELGQRGSTYDERIRQYDGSVLDWLPGGGETVLMTRDFIPETNKSETRIVRRQDGLGVVRLNVRTLKSEIVEQPNRSMSGFMSDGVGHVRLAMIDEVDGTGILTGRTRYNYRLAGSNEWRRLVDFQSDEFIPLAIDATVDTLYALKKLDGRWALYRIKLNNSLESELVASNAKVDIDNVVRLGDGQKVIGYTYADDRRHTIYFDPELSALAKSLSKALPHLPLVDFVNASDDGSKILMFAGSDSDPGRYYVYDKAKRSLGEIVLARPELEGRALAAVKPVVYAAADGARIPAYLTLPAGSSGKGLPAVVLPHGGPSARDEWGFDWLAQFLAARGYAVIQPNYRGSAGFGDAWLAQNGFKGWRTSIGDVSAAARWLAEQGIADPRRIAIVGWSYGGYAALQSAATEPSLYRAAAAIAPVTDLAQLKTDAENYTNSQLVAAFVGAGPHIEDGSPLRRAATIPVPVLLAHGDMDINVRVTHSRRMNAALRGAGRTSEYLEFKGLDHQLDDSAARKQVLVQLGALLDKTIGN